MIDWTKPIRIKGSTVPHGRRKFRAVAVVTDGGSWYNLDGSPQEKGGPELENYTPAVEIRFIPDGEPRVPKKGDWFRKESLPEDNEIIKATFDWNGQVRQIYRQVAVPVE